MGVVESAIDEFVGLNGAEMGLGPPQLAWREHMIRSVVVSAIVLTQVAWLVVLIFAAWVVVFS